MAPRCLQDKAVVFRFNSRSLFGRLAFPLLAPLLFRTLLGPLLQFLFLPLPFVRFGAFGCHYVASQADCRPVPGRLCEVVAFLIAFPFCGAHADF